MVRKIKKNCSSIKQINEGDSLVKHFNVWMAGLISGIVALFTSYLGISGTIIGSVLSSFLYQFLSSYSAEKYDEGAIRKPNLANEIVYIFPLVVIGIIELIFLLSALHYRFDMLFDILESAVANNLFRLMGIGLIILGAYPFFNSNDIDKRNGLAVLIIGALLLMRGFVDISEITAKAFYKFFAPFDMLFALFVVVVLAIVIFNILIGSGEILKSNEFINSHKPKKPYARKIDTSFNNAHLNRAKKYNFNWNRGADSHLDKREDDFNSEKGSVSNLNEEPYDSNLNNKNNQEELPLYEEEIILVNNPDNPDNPIKKRILKRVKQDSDSGDDDYQDVYLLDELE